MEWLNYHHLYYFWTVVKEGSVSRAAERLRLAQPTISGQIRALEENFGEALLVREGRGVRVSEVGQTVFRYADEIFTLGRELQDVVKGLPTGRPLRLAVGVAEMVPKLLAHRLLEPALKISGPVRLYCYEDTADRLLARLAMHELDMVLSDMPASPGVSVRAYNHLLGESTISFFAAEGLAKSLKRTFPRSLDGAPMLMPMEGAALRRSLDNWLDAQGVRPNIVADFADSALMKVFAQNGMGVFAAPTAAADEIVRQYDVKLLGQADEVKERFYAISAERRIKHPAVLALSQIARRELAQSA
ncbi:MAG: transcriptional activator NhaR [Myxococcales bacterium]|nr:transcriptional activator NhaR [Myxococcales bacterium]